MSAPHGVGGAVCSKCVPRRVGPVKLDTGRLSSFDNWLKKAVLQPRERVEAELQTKQDDGDKLSDCIFMKSPDPWISVSLLEKPKFPHFVS